MSDRGTTRIELNLATGLIALAIVCVGATTCWAGIEHLAPSNLKELANMPANGLLALIAVLSLLLSGYLIRLLFGKLLSALDENTKSNTVLARLLAERPCIRDPKND